MLLQQDLSKKVAMCATATFRNMMDFILDAVLYFHKMFHAGLPTAFNLP